MKKRWLVLIICFMIICLLGCGKKEISLENATLERSPLSDLQDGNGGIEIEIVEQTKRGLTVQITNNTKNWWGYGVSYRLEVFQDGEWYKVPTLPGEWAFIEIWIELEPGQTNEEAYDFEMYGELPSGKYRIIIEDHYAEFEVK